MTTAYSEYFKKASSTPESLTVPKSDVASETDMTPEEARKEAIKRRLAKRRSTRMR